MSSQYEVKSTEGEAFDIKSDSFVDPIYARTTYTVIRDEYEHKITPIFSHITKAKGQLPPYWDEGKNAPAKMPMYQHNVSAGRFKQSMIQLTLPYNSFFPNQSYSKSIIEVKITESKVDKEEQNPSLEKSKYVENAFDKVVKNESWSKSEHLKMVADVYLFGVGLYYFEEPKTSYKYKKLDIRKVKFPPGTSVEVSDWEYLFVEHDVTINSLIQKYKELEENKSQAKDGWKKDALKEVLTSVNNSKGAGSSLNTVTPNKVNMIDNVRAGGNTVGTLQSSAASLPVITVFWKNVDGTISSGTFIADGTVSYTDKYIFYKEKLADSFVDVFSVFISDVTESEIRLCKGQGHSVYSLCHAYDRAFCKFLDHLDYSASLFLNMDPADMHKKILNFGSINIGKFDSIQNIPSVLRGIIESLVFLDSKIDQLTFTSGLNKTELLGGDTPNAELANIMLTMEGRVHKHFLARFLEQYTIHWKKVLGKILSIINNEAHLALNPELKVRFIEYLASKGIANKDLKLDDTSQFNHGLPSHWEVVCRKPDGSGITGTVPHVIRALQPYITSLPEAGYKYLLGRIISEAFGDTDMLEKILPGADMAKVTSDADAQQAQVQVALLTATRSEFDRDFDIMEDIDPQLTDSHKFVVFPSIKDQDHFIFLETIFAKIDEIQERLAKREIGRTTLHIWLYNLVSTAKNHVDHLQSDQVRANRPEASQLYEKFGQVFNLLRQVESQANADRAKKIDALQKKIAEQAQDDPKRMEAMAKLETARARQAEVQLKYDTNNFKKALDTQLNRRAEENHVIDQRLKIKALLEPSNTISQGGSGRPRSNDQNLGMSNG